MKNSNQNSWISCFLYFKSGSDSCLINDVRPFIMQLKKQGSIRQFFFVRYVDSHGLHIRLRLLPAQTTSEQYIKRAIRKQFSDVRFVKYAPETERYGGPAGVPIAERLFNASSDAVLQHMSDSQSWHYGRALNSTIQLHVGMAQAFGLSSTETARLFDHIAQSGNANESSLKQFEQIFTSQRSRLVPATNSLWRAYESNAVFKEAWFANWRQATLEIGQDIERAYKAHALVLPEQPYHDSPLWFLYESYIHMTNNRLGLSRKDEHLIAFILKECLLTGMIAN